jgi:hypothetical protein
LVFAKALPVKLKALWFVAFIISSIWFLYWICYDIFVWNKALTQVAPTNYAGFAILIALTILGTRLEKVGIFEKLIRNPEPNMHKKATESQQAPERNQEQPIKQAQQSQRAKEERTQIPPGALIPDGCKFYIGYLHTRRESEIPEDCLQCEHVVECLSPAAHTIEKTTS